MVLKLFLWSLFLIWSSGKCENFPSLITTNASLAVVIDREFLNEKYEEIKNEIEKFLVYAEREILKHGGVNVHLYSWTSINVRKDLTAIFSIASCSDTWKLYRLTEAEELVHMAISETDCLRLPSETSITIPLIPRGEELPQILLDLKSANIHNWDRLVIIYDVTIDQDMITRVIKCITQLRSNNIKATGISLMRLEPNISRPELKSVLSTIDPKILGRNYLVISSYYITGIIMEYTKELNLVGTTNQWMYLISDTNSNFSDIDIFESLLREGDNIAFMYNTSTNGRNCVGRTKCYTEDLLRAFTMSLDQAILDELNIANQVSEEEWEAIRPNKNERREFLLKNMKVRRYKY